MGENVTGVNGYETAMGGTEPRETKIRHNYTKDDKELILTVRDEYNNKPEKLKAKHYEEISSSMSTSQGFSLLAASLKAAVTRFARKGKLPAK